MQFFSASAYAKGTLLGACFIGLADLVSIVCSVRDTLHRSLMLYQLLLSSSHMNAGRGLVDVTEHFVLV